MAANTVKANATGSTANASDVTGTALLEAVFSSTQGAILYRGASVWSALAPGAAGQALVTNGAAANPSWQGQMVAQVVNTETGAVATGTTTLPGAVDTIPTNTQGDQYMSLAITPTNTS